MKGVLKIQKVKKGNEYRAFFENAKGKMVEMPILPQNCHFDLAKVLDGDELVFELEKGIPVNCKVPGKEGTPKIVQKPPVQPEKKDNFKGARRDNSRRGSSSGDKALCNAVAPYNFVPFEVSSVIPPFEDEPRRWSGKLVLRLKALTPLLISDRQEKASDDSPNVCRFMRLKDRYVIPGTSIKGMLRSLMEILTFSNLLPVSDKKLFWRSVPSQEYRERFDTETIRGGYLRKEGAQYFLTPVSIYAKKPEEGPVAGCEPVKTGGMKVRNTNSAVYYFAPPDKDAVKIPLDSEIVASFRSQLTPNQESEERWPEKKRSHRLESAHGLPVFYRTDKSGQVCDLGFCRYFRIPYAYSPFDLAYPDKQMRKPDFITSLFGSAEKGMAFAGRIAIEAAFVDGKPYCSSGMELVLGSPKPTCLPLYLVQNPDKVKTFRNNHFRNDPSKMDSYNDPDARLRGHKLYWHHDVDPAFFPGREVLAGKDGKKNLKVASILHPLAPGASATLVVHVDHLADVELGALLEALLLPSGHAHKLGMGKSLGFGSVRLELVEAAVADMREIHSSLCERLAQDHAPLDLQTVDSLRARFRQRVLDAVRKNHKAWEKIDNYDNLPPIRALRIMMDYARRPTAEEVRTMTLQKIPDDPLTSINFSNNAILPSPEEVIRNGKRRH